jgi:hypothetical protein
MIHNLYLITVFTNILYSEIYICPYFGLILNDNINSSHNKRWMHFDIKIKSP